MSDDLIGKQIGGYEILDAIGRGGMATVYRARQSSMNRSVALKVLPRQYINDETYMQRFVREVEIVSQLEHRNIVPVHDYGEYDGQPYIVMRYMTAGSVDDLLKHGPLPLDKVLDIVEQITPALDYAHSKNVLHRDLKPSNILLDDDGGAYITDFGIARILDEQHTAGITTQGVVGTPSYMSPEQAQGHDLDGRSDLYSLGIMIFEMLTARRPFESDTPYSIAVMQVMTPPPSPRVFNPEVPPQVENVIFKALEKKRENRYPTGVQLSQAMKEAVANIGKLEVTQPHQPFASRTPPQIVSQPRVSVSTSSRQPTRPTPPPQYTFSPYGTQSSAQSAARPSTRTGLQPPQKRRSNLWLSIAFGGLIGCGLLALLVIAIVFVIGTISSQDSPESELLATPEDNIVATDENGSLATPAITDSAAQNALDLADGFPTILPSPTANVVDDHDVTAPLSAASGAGSQSGALLFFAERDNNFDIYRLDLATREEVRLTSHPASDSYPMMSPDGTQMVFQSNRDGDFDIYIADPDGGNVRPVTDNDFFDRLASWSPDGNWIIFSSDIRNDGTFDLFRVRPDGTNLQRIYSDAHRNSHPRWSSDNRYIVFTGGDADDAQTWDVKRLEVGSDRVENLTDNDEKDWSPAFSPDGKQIIFLQPGLGNASIAVMDVDGGNQRVLFDGPGYEWGANFSPDGRFIAFTSDETGQEELYLMEADGSNVQRLTSNGGSYPTWVN